MAGRKMSGYQKATANLAKEGDRQCHLIYGAAGLAFYRHWGWRKDRILKLMDLTVEVWNECAKDPDTCMIEMCENETGIEIQNGNGKSWKDLPYMNAKLNPGRMTMAQCIYMRQRQIQWLAPQIMAAIMVALHRKYGFGYERCARVYSQIMEIEHEFKMDPKLLKNACLMETGVNITDKIRKRPE